MLWHILNGLKQIYTFIVKKSKVTKNNDYDGDDLSFEKLVSALKKEGVNFFSITDHNIINETLYGELIQRREELVSENLNFVIGAEIDFF